MNRIKGIIGALLVGVVVLPNPVCGQDATIYSLDLQGIISLAIEQKMN